MTTQIEASDLVGAVAGLVPGSPLAEARGSRAVARDQIQAAESALFTRGTATIPRRDRLIVGAFAAALTDPDGALAVHRVGQLADADAALVDRLTFRSHVLDMSGPSYRLLTAQASANQ